MKPSSRILARGLIYVTIFLSPLTGAGAVAFLALPPSKEGGYPPKPGGLSALTGLHFDYSSVSTLRSPALIHLNKNLKENFEPVFE